MTDHGSSAWSTSEPAAHPNAAWLENLYSQYMDEPEAPAKKRKKEMLDVAFAAEDRRPRSSSPPSAACSTPSRSSRAPPAPAPTPAPNPGVSA